jgi:hypothetical protein
VLDAAVDSWLENLENERALDEPLRALLRASGFHDIRLVHGPTELGRDFIAKRRHPEGVRQYAIQSKLGDLNLGAFRDVRNQLEDIRTTEYPDADFDNSLPRVAVLATTGEIKGPARTEASGYQEYVARDDGRSVEYWERGRLIDDLVASPGSVLAGRDAGPLLRILGLVDSDEIDERELTRFSRRWIPGEGQTMPPAAVIEAALIAESLVHQDRIDLACAISLALLRAPLVGAHRHDDNDDTWASPAQASGLFIVYAEQLWTRCQADERIQDPIALANQGGAGVFATYPVRCLKVIELLGLLGLHRRAHGEDAGEVQSYLEDFLTRHPGAAHPISDRYAVSLVPPACLLGQARVTVLEPWLRATAVWVLDHYQTGTGLGNVEASPAAEIEYLLSAFEHIDPPPHRTSYLATVILDLICALELSTIYPDAVGDFAVFAPPELLHIPATRAQYLEDGDEIRQEAGVAYHDAWAPKDGWKNATHHDHVEPSWLEANGRAWEKLAVASVTRDRHDIGLIRRTVLHPSQTGAGD